MSIFNVYHKSRTGLKILVQDWTQEVKIKCIFFKEILISIFLCMYILKGLEKGKNVTSSNIGSDLGNVFTLP